MGQGLEGCGYAGVGGLKDAAISGPAEGGGFMVAVLRGHAGVGGFTDAAILCGFAEGEGLKQLFKPMQGSGL